MWGHPGGAQSWCDPFGVEPALPPCSGGVPSALLRAVSVSRTVPPAFLYCPYRATKFESGWSSVAPPGLVPYTVSNPRLAPWATVLRPCRGYAPCVPSCYTLTVKMVWPLEPPLPRGRGSDKACPLADASGSDTTIPFLVPPRARGRGGVCAATGRGDWRCCRRTRR